MDTYTLIGPVNYGGQPLKAGDSIDLTPEQAAFYRAEGLIAPEPGELEDFDADAALDDDPAGHDTDPDGDDTGGAEGEGFDADAALADEGESPEGEATEPAAPRRGRKPKGA